MVFTLPMTFMAKEGQSLVINGDVKEKTTPVAVMLEKDKPIMPLSLKVELNELLEITPEKKAEVVE